MLASGSIFSDPSMPSTSIINVRRLWQRAKLSWPDNPSIPFWCDSKPEFASGKTVVSSKVMNDLG
jgi:hypothetical protein